MNSLFEIFLFVFVIGDRSTIIMHETNSVGMINIKLGYIINNL